MHRTALLALSLPPFAGLLGTPAAEAAISVAGMGHYCSGTWASGGWAFTSLTNGCDPCQSITAAGGTIQRRGLHANNNWNRVVYRCYPPGYGFVGVYQGWGNAPLTWAFDAAKRGNKPGCIFTVSPTAMQVFDPPFDLAAPYYHASGVDFARGKTLDVKEFGQLGSAKATIVDWTGRHVSGGYLDDHAGHDWPMKTGTDIKAVADGVVTMARDFNSECKGSDLTLQKEVAITHAVIGNSARYYEEFLSYYAHLDGYSVKVGQSVKRGEVIGTSGNTGCSSAPHLHFGTIRLTNTSDKLSEPVTFFASKKHSDASDQLIEP